MKYILFSFLLLINCQLFAQELTGTIEQEDANIFYKVFGSKGKPILFINGGPGFSSNYLDEIAQELSEYKYQVILFDQRGTGDSTVKSLSKRYISNKKNLDDIDAVVNHLGYKKINIIGHAYGSTLALMYATEHPEKVDKLVLSSPTGTNLDFAEPMIANLKLRLDAKKIDQIKQTQNDHKKRLDLMAEAYIYDKANIEKVRAMHQEDKDYSYEINQIIWDEMRDREFDITERVKGYNGSVLILHGRQDVIGESAPIYTHLTLPNSELHLINEAIRYLWIDQPEEYLNYLTSFLR